MTESDTHDPFEEMSNSELAEMIISSVVGSPDVQWRAEPGAEPVRYAAPSFRTIQQVAGYQALKTV